MADAAPLVIGQGPNPPRCLPASQAPRPHVRLGHEGAPSEWQGPDIRHSDVWQERLPEEGREGIWGGGKESRKERYFGGGRSMCKGRVVRERGAQASVAAVRVQMERGSRQGSAKRWE